VGAVSEERVEEGGCPVSDFDKALKQIQSDRGGIGEQTVFDVGDNDCLICGKRETNPKNYRCRHCGFPSGKLVLVMVKDEDEEESEALLVSEVVYKRVQRKHLADSVRFGR
jgi:rubredoxin